MSPSNLQQILADRRKAFDALDAGNIGLAVSITLQIEQSCQGCASLVTKLNCEGLVAGCLIDIGAAAKDGEMIKRGISYLESIASNPEVANLGTSINSSVVSYNTSNGYAALWKLRSADYYFENGLDAFDHRKARHYIRQATDNRDVAVERDLVCQMWVNYGNLLDSVWRNVEALDAYDQALIANNSMGMALGNKGISLFHLARFMHGHSHRFYLEAQRLLREALLQPDVFPAAAKTFKAKLENIEAFIKEHGGVLALNEIDLLEPKTEFHRFLCDYSAKQRLFLHPVTLLTEEAKRFFGDPMFIADMYSQNPEDAKFEKYDTFLNQIKQDYVLARYFLVQSQYRSSDLDAVDDGVFMMYPQDYSLNGTYIELLKSAMRQVISVLDKIAFFIRDYCQLTSPAEDRVDFRNIWNMQESDAGYLMRSELIQLSNPYLFALFGLACDLSRKGDWERLNGFRNALTHRFLVVHDSPGEVVNSLDIPRVRLQDFLEDALFALRTARAAIMYLILFVQTEEQKLLGEDDLLIPAFSMPITPQLRYSPPFGPSRSE